MLDRPDSAADPIEDVIRLCRLERARPAWLNAGGNWGVTFEKYDHAKFAVILKGSCWISGTGLGEPAHLTTGDAYVLAQGEPYRLGSAPTGPAESGARLFAAAPDGVARAGDATDEDVKIIGGSFSFSSRQAGWLLEAMEPLVVLRRQGGETGAAARMLKAAVEALAAETRSPGLGSALVIERLADLLLIQALRTVVAGGVKGEQAGWLTALADPEIGQALHLMHENPARRWTVADLAAQVGLSRSAFAERFRRLVGRPPLGYLVQWRMASAAAELEAGDRSVAAVAGEWGYESESAFSSAFKRVMGAAPTHYRAALRLP